MIDEPRSRWFRLSEWNGNHRLAALYPVALVETRWRPLAETLDAIREAVGKAITITPNGGFRAQSHNAAVGGKRNSRHMFGDAADIRADHTSSKKLHSLILTMYREGKLPRLGGLGLYPTFVHVDTRPRAKGAKLARWDETGENVRAQLA